ncbi:MAG: hypothetical protein ACR2IP_02060 [Solirubrobacteraceae bacterium]
MRTARNSQAVARQTGFARWNGEVHAEGTGARVQPLAIESLEQRGDRLAIPPSGMVVTDDELVRVLRDVDQR